MKTFIKKKAGPNQAGPGFRTPDHFKGSVFSERKLPGPVMKFKPGLFKIQHKG